MSQELPQLQMARSFKSRDPEAIQWASVYIHVSVHLDSGDHKLTFATLKARY